MMPEIRVGFTGTRDGMSARQWRAVSNWLAKTAWPGTEIMEVHQGCCVGSDAEFVQAVLDFVGCKIHAHPSTLTTLTDKWTIDVANVKHDPLPPLDRNRVIVESCDVLLATPKGPEAQYFQSGTWATVRHARKLKKRIVLVWRDGTVTQEGE